MHHRSQNDAGGDACQSSLGKEGIAWEVGPPEVCESLGN